MCHYPSPKTGYGCYIGLSSKMVDNGTPAASVAAIIRHELSHACCPGQKHNHVWKAFNQSISGDGERCCNDKIVEAIIGYPFVIRCEKGCCSTGRQKKPSFKIRDQIEKRLRVCKTCKEPVRLIKNTRSVS